MSLDYSHVTVCFSLPRSRSQWLAWLFKHAGIVSWHDPLNACEHPTELTLAAPRDRQVFMADTSAVLFHRQLKTAMPGARFLYVLRDPHQVANSLRAQTGFPYESRMQRMNVVLRAAAADAPPGDVCNYEDVTEFARHHWPSITGKPDPGQRFWEHTSLTHIDVPVREQPAYPEKRAALLRHADY